MTREQIAVVLDVSKQFVYEAFKAAQKEHPELKEKTISSNTNQKGKGADYTLDETLLAMSYARDGKGISELEKTFIEESFSMRPKKPKAIGIDGTEEFLKKVSAFPKMRCCSTCSFCTRMSMRNSKPVMKPYCNFWSRFLHRIKANPYKDFCKQWEYSDRPPLVFYKAGSPANVDIHGNVKNEVLGYDVSNFGKSDGKGITLVTDIGISGQELPCS